MPVKIAINGYGRIGSSVVRAIYEYGLQDKVQVVAINSRSPIETIAHLTRYDSIHGRFNTAVETPSNDQLVIGGDAIRYTQYSDPAKCDWSVADVVMECTGVFRSREKAQPYFDGGAKRVLVSAPADGAEAFVVYGVNEEVLQPEHTFVSNASCTTNCLAPIAKVLDDTVGIEKGLMTTIHSYTTDQRLLDQSHKDLRRARAAGVSMIPTKTGAAKAVGLVLPQLAGKVDGFSVRVPTTNVSVVDLSFNSGRDTSVEEINAIIKAASEADNSLGHVIGYNTEPLVSVDFLHRPESTIFDATQTRVSGGDFVKIMTWYDNEWGFSNRMIDTAIAMTKA
ncbi:MAG: type I glyceraldehyde-3-phosphate dehydrogenase [Gammaproteobacteria bacterium]|nr:MAG: type I glyceraldehyde-3-phosphate dehydrogenase [Gammaproteobacteria bacterium]